jgi:hypothetical protein
MDGEREAIISDEPDDVSRLDYLLYLIFELESAVDRGGIEWTPQQAKAVFGRLIHIAARVGAAAHIADGK